MREFWKCVCFVCFLLATLGIITAAVFQAVLVYRVYGVVGTNGYGVPHKSLWFFASAILYIPSIIIYKKLGD